MQRLALSSSHSQFAVTGVDIIKDVDLYKVCTLKYHVL